MKKTVLDRSTPEQMGIASAAILAFVDKIEANVKELHSFMLLRHGRVVAEGWWGPYEADLPHTLFSLTKSFTSTAVGLAVAEGRLTVHDKVISFFPEDLPAVVDENLAKMEVHHLLSMATGHHEDSTDRMIRNSKGNWARGFLALPVEHEPGTHFVYNSGASYMLGVIVQKVTGMGMKAYLKPRLFEPLGIKTPRWERCPKGIEIGGWGLHVRTEDIARFGQMYLQKGRWNDRQILPESWVVEASKKQVSNGSDPLNDWAQGYGYQFWRCKHNNFRGDGAFGQFCIVMPEQDAVLAITSGTGDMQGVMNIAWEQLLPAFCESALPEDPGAQQALIQRVAGLRLDPPQAALQVGNAKKFSGKKYLFGENPFKLKAFTFEFGAQGCVMTVEQGTRVEVVECGWGDWKKTITRLFSDRPEKLAASCAWRSESTLEVTLRHYETPFYYTLVCDFSAEELCLRGSVNVSFGPTQFPELVGYAERDTSR